MSDERSEEGIESTVCSDWAGMDSAPTDGTEVVGWVPYKGHVLMRYRDGWEFYNSIPMTRKPGHYIMGWSRFGTMPTHWRPKQENSREWIH